MHSPEWYEKRDIDEFLAAIGTYNVKPTTGGFGSSGTSDRICCYKGRFFSVEVKRPGLNGKRNPEPTALQWKRMAEVEAAGGTAFWGTAAKVIPEIKAWLANL